MEMLHRITVLYLLLVLFFGHSLQKERRKRQGFDDSSGDSCTTPLNVAGVCINIKDCALHLDYLVNKRTQPGIKEYLQAALCRKQGSQIFTCCPVKKSVNFESGNECQTPKNAPGVCINIKKCNELLEMLKRRQEPGVTEYLRASQCGLENRDPKVCCPSSSGVSEPVRGNSVLPGLDVCGLSDAANNRVVNGRPAVLGSWPWMVALGYRSTKKPLEWLCGGSLISDRYVLTAAHCLNAGSRVMYLARMGDLNLDDKVTDRALPVDIEIERTIPHEKYDAKLHTDDIALVKLRNPVEYTKLIRPVCLPSSDTFQADLTGYSPFVIGWGATSYRGPTTTALQEAQIDITDEQSCSNAYRNQKAKIDYRVICALSPLGKDACQGDSGGPLLLPKKKNFFVIGVVSYGYKCADPNYPGVYTKVTNFYDWIKNNMS